jgi:tetratricopeptide (TPR) repeat protein
LIVGLFRPAVFACGLAAALLVTGCAARQTAPLTNRFLKAGKPKSEYPAEIFKPRSDDKSQTEESAKARALALRQGPPLRTALPSLEATDATLIAALRDLQAGKSAPRHVAVGDAYRRLGVLDLAVEHYEAAKSLDRRAASAYDGLARVWRDVRRPDFGLPEATRAVHYAPGSPEALNTLGTVLFALGDLVEARKAFEKALAIDPSAGYARQNVTLAAERLDHMAIERSE